MSSADLSFSAAPAAVTQALNDGVARLNQLGVIRAQGEDAARFLHGQLTQDFALLDAGQARLAALCSPKGRMLASFVGFKRAPDDLLLVCSADLLQATLRRLAMFVLRAKVRLSDESSAWTVWGLSGQAVARHGADAGRTEAAPWLLAATDAGSTIRLYPADGVPRALCIAEAGRPAPDGPSLDESLWLWSEVRSGVARLTQPVADAFVPQMLNYESVGGVNFQKGCYPGQEVVARSQFRGTLKRRAYLVHGSSQPNGGAALAAGTGIFAESEPDQPVGQMVLAAAAPQGGWDAIACLSVAAVGAGALRLGTATGPVLHVEPPPYPLRDDL